MDKRQYNIFYHLHTVAGIVLSILLFVIFFAGTFSFFRDEIVNWERNDIVTTEKGLGLPLNNVMEGISDTMNLYGRDITITRPRDENMISVSIDQSKDTTQSTTERAGSFFYVFTDDLQSKSYEESYTFGEFIYRLHFFSQLRIVGRYLSGLVGLFLMFIVLTGVLVHWKKIILNFYVFRSKEKLKVIWKDIHTVLATIGIPFQFVYGLTGAFFFLKIIMMLPIVGILYEGDQDQMMKDIDLSSPKHELSYKKMNTHINYDSLIAITSNKWEEFNVDHLHIYNHSDSSMIVSVDGLIPYKTKMTGFGGLDFEIATDKIIKEHSPFDKMSYSIMTLNIMNIIHLGNYAGIGLRITSFILGLACCFVVISGIMIWLETRIKSKKISIKRKNFNSWVGYIYLAICLSMYPITAFSFVFTRLLPIEYNDIKMTMIYYIYFIGWLILSVFLSIKKDNYFTNKFTLILGGLLGLLVPIIDLTMTKSINSFMNIDFLVINLIWLILGVSTTIVGFSLKKQPLLN